MAKKAQLTDLVGAEQIEEEIVEALKTVYDPEIPVNIYDMGLIYEIEVDEAGAATVNMTLTSPACPVAQSLPLAVKDKVASASGVTEAQVNVVWDPPWTMERMSDEAKFELGLLDVEEPVDRDRRR